MQTVNPTSFKGKILQTLFRRSLNWRLREFVAPRYLAHLVYGLNLEARHIEIDSGRSTTLASQEIADMQLRTVITSIDPERRAKIDDRWEATRFRALFPSNRELAGYPGTS